MSHRFGPRTRLTFSGATARVAQWLQPSVIRSIQRGTITVTGAQASNTATITAVNTNNSRLRLLWMTSNGTGGTAFTHAARLTLTNTTTVTANRNSASGVDVVVGFEVTEYWPRVLRSVQRGSITIAIAATSNTATITAVNTGKTELNWLGQQTDEANDADGYAKLILTNATTVTANRTGGGGVAGTVTASYEVVEWF